MSKFPTEDLVSRLDQERRYEAKKKNARRTLSGGALDRRLRQIEVEKWFGWTDDGNVRRYD